MSQALINIGKQYLTEEQFRKHNISKYLQAKRLGLLRVIFPPHTCALPPDYVNPNTISEAKSKALLATLECRTAIATFEATDFKSVEDISKTLTKLGSTIQTILRRRSKTLE